MRTLSIDNDLMNLQPYLRPGDEEMSESDSDISQMDHCEAQLTLSSEEDNVNWAEEVERTTMKNKRKKKNTFPDNEIRESVVQKTHFYVFFLLI